MNIQYYFSRNPIFSIGDKSHVWKKEMLPTMNGGLKKQDLQNNYSVPSRFSQHDFYLLYERIVVPQHLG